MIKRDVIDDSKSHFNTAYDQEHLFVLCARDPAAPATIRAWITERLRLGRNKPGDEQVREAFECATLMELQHGEIAAARGQQQPWAKASETSAEPTATKELTFAIARLASHIGTRLEQAEVTWSSLTALLSEPRQSPCTRATCLNTKCPHKRGPCWSPAKYNNPFRASAVESVGLLVFDVDQATNDQIREIQERITSRQYLVHSTHSDQPSSRCLRFVFPLSRPVDLATWDRFWPAAWRSLVPIAEPTCSDARRFYFLPSCPRDVNYFIQVNTGTLLDVDTLLSM